MSMTLSERMKQCYEAREIPTWGDILNAADDIDRLTRQLADAQAELLMWRASFPASAEAVQRDALSPPHAAAKRTIYERCEKCGTIYRPGERHACAHQPDM
jgi:hypothetical protein